MSVWSTVSVLASFPAIQTSSFVSSSPACKINTAFFFETPLQLSPLVVSLCAAIAAQAGAPLSASAITVEYNFTSGNLYCNETDPLYGEPLFQSIFANFTIRQPNTTNTTISLLDVPCIGGGYSSNVTNNTLSCTDPLVVNGGGCSFVCPLPSLTDRQYSSAKIMQGIVSWFSWVFLPLIRLSCFLLPKFILA